MCPILPIPKDALDSEYSSYFHHALEVVLAFFIIQTRPRKVFFKIVFFKIKFNKSRQQSILQINNHVKMISLLYVLNSTEWDVGAWVVTKLYKEIIKLVIFIRLYQNIHLITEFFSSSLVLSSWESRTPILTSSSIR